jgi:hypothetical protein
MVKDAKEDLTEYEGMQFPTLLQQPIKNCHQTEN